MAAEEPGIVKWKVFIHLILTQIIYQEVTSNGYYDHKT